MVACTPRPDPIGNFDVIALKITSDGNLVWQRTYSAGDVVDPRGGLTVASDGSVYMAGALQTVRRTADIAALIVKLSTNGDLLGQRDSQRSGGRAGRRHSLRRRDDNQLRCRVSRRVRSSPASDWQEIARRGYLGRNGFRGRVGRWRDRWHGRARGDYHKSATVFIAQCLGETIGSKRYAGGRRRNSGLTRRHLCRSRCGRRNAERKYDLRWKLRSSPRQNRSVTFSGPQVVQAPGSDDLEVKGSLAAIIRGSDDIFS